MSGSSRIAQRFHLLITFREAGLDGKRKQVGGINNMLQVGEIKVV